MIEAGQKVISMLVSAWNFYGRIIKGYLEYEPNEEHAMTYNAKNITMARGQIDDMLKEMRNSKYRWDSFTTEGLGRWELQYKEIEEERNFTNLLNNILKKQTDKVIRARIKE